MSEQDDSNDNRGFKVKDHRILDASGNPTSSGEDKNMPKSGTSADSASAPSESPIAEDINFTSFVMSLSTSIMIHLGLAPNPMTNLAEEDVDMAEKEIGILEMLKEKTKDNLTDQEQKLIDDVLFHLRMKYVEKKKSLA